MAHSRPRKYIRHKIINPLLALLTMGITPQKLALTVALGVIVGIMPLFGLATLICTVLGWRFKLNIPALLLICYLLAPLHLLLYLPFIKAGIFIFQAEEFKLTIDEILDLFRLNWLVAMEKLWLANLLGVAAWLLISIPLTGIIYLSVLPVFKKYVRLPEGKNHIDENIPDNNI